MPRAVAVALCRGKVRARFVGRRQVAGDSGLAYANPFRHLLLREFPLDCGPCFYTGRARLAALAANAGVLH